MSHLGYLVCLWPIIEFERDIAVQITHYFYAMAYRVRMKSVNSNPQRTMKTLIALQLRQRIESGFK